MTAQSITGPAIRVRGLEKSYGKLDVLRGVDFDVARGDIFALLGSNGSGKTTTVRILATLLKADAGTASVNGFDDQFVHLLDSIVVESSPGAERVLAILEERGWRGWTRIERVPADRLNAELPP